MNVSARDIEQVEFHDAWRGYNQGEVDDFLDHVGETVERLERENEFLRGKLKEIESSVETARVSEEMLKKTLLAAQKTAEETIAEARAEADRLLSEASSGADRRKHELEESLASLQRFESETKQRLRSVLEDQLRALDALNEMPVEAAESTRATGEPEAAHAQGVEVQAAGVAVDAAPTPVQPAPDNQVGGDAAAMSAEEPEAESTDTSLFDFEGAEESDEPDEPGLDDFRPFDDEAELQGRRRRGLFRRKVDDWA